MFTAVKEKLPKALVWPWKWVPPDIPNGKLFFTWDRQPNSVADFPPSKDLLEQQVRQAELQMISQMRRWG